MFAWTPSLCVHAIRNSEQALSIYEREKNVRYIGHASNASLLLLLLFSSSEWPWCGRISVSSLPRVGRHASSFSRSCLWCSSTGVRAARYLSRPSRQERRTSRGKPGPRKDAFCTEATAMRECGGVIGRNVARDLCSRISCCCSLETGPYVGLPNSKRRLWQPERYLLLWRRHWFYCYAYSLRYACERKGNVSTERFGSELSLTISVCPHTKRSHCFTDRYALV